MKLSKMLQGLSRSSFPVAKTTVSCWSLYGWSDISKLLQHLTENTLCIWDEKVYISEQSESHGAVSVPEAASSWILRYLCNCTQGKTRDYQQQWKCSSSFSSLQFSVSYGLPSQAFLFLLESLIQLDCFPSAQWPFLNVHLLSMKHLFRWICCS